MTQVSVCYMSTPYLPVEDTDNNIATTLLESRWWQRTNFEFIIELCHLQKYAVISQFMLCDSSSATGTLLGVANI